VAESPITILAFAGGFGLLGLLLGSELGLKCSIVLFLICTLVSVAVTAPATKFATEHDDFFAVDLTEAQLCDLQLLPLDTKIRSLELLESKKVSGHVIARVVYSISSDDDDPLRRAVKSLDFKLYKELDYLLEDVKDVEYCGRSLRPQDDDVLESLLGSAVMAKTN